MNNLLSFALAAVILAAPVRAQTVAGSAAQAGSWTAAVSGALAAGGTSRIASFGSTSLTNLTTLTPEGHFPFAAAPNALTPLIEALQAEHTPEAFAALSADEKLEAIRSAATAAEIKASAAADAAVAAASKPVHDADASGRIAAAETVALYLPKATLERVAAARAAVETDERQRNEKVRRSQKLEKILAEIRAGSLDAKIAEALSKTTVEYLHAVRADLRKYSAPSSETIDYFFEALPEKIAAGAFNASNLIVHDADGWYAADGTPKLRYDYLKDLYEARLKRIAANPVGPWTVAEYALLRESLERPDVAKALDYPQASEQEWYRSQWPGLKASSPDQVWSTEDARPSSKLKTDLEERQRSVRDWIAGHPELQAAVRRFAARTPHAEDFKAVERFYASQDDAVPADSTSRARIKAWMMTEGASLPSKDQLLNIKRQLNHASIIGGFVLLLKAALIVGGIIGGFVFWSLPAVIVMFVLYIVAQELEPFLRRL